MSATTARYTTAPSSTTWLWPHYLPLGKITLLAGDPGLGKSFIALDLAARLSQNLPFPSSPQSKLQDTHLTLLLSAEDQLQDTIIPRILAQGGNPNLIVPVRALDARSPDLQPFSLKTDLKLLRILLEKSHAKLLILDPITSFMQGIDHNSTSQLRQYLTPLAQLAAHHNVAVLAITHLNKRTQARTLYRAAGSLALAAIARSVLLVYPHPTARPPCNLLSLLKSNLAAPQPPLPFHITHEKLEWLPPLPTLNASDSADPFGPGPFTPKSPEQPAPDYEHQGALFDVPGRRPGKESPGGGEGGDARVNDARDG